MNTNIVISLDTRRSKKDGSYPLIIRLGHNERTTSIPLGISLRKADWDAKSRVVRKSYIGSTSVTRLNNQIQKKRATAKDIILKLDEAGKLASMSITDIRDRIAHENKSESFTKYAERVIAELEEANRIGTARSYQGVLNILNTFYNNKDIQFKDITYQFLNRLEINHKSKGNEANGLAVYMRTIRAIYNKGIKAGVADKELYPFHDYKIKTTPTVKRALEWEFIKKIVERKLKPEDSCFNARNYFLASYMMYGMNFTDMAFLQRTNIINGRILYRRKKTSKIFDIKVTESLNVILQYYMEKTPDSDYIFPIIKRESAALQNKDILWARKRYNKKLKVLAELCEIDKTLTSYVSRHSFATQAMLQNVPINAISTMLGHSSLKTTEVYLKGLPSNILDDYNSLILNG